MTLVVGTLLLKETKNRVVREDLLPATGRSAP
jgi:hypothetical protein